MIVHNVTLKQVGRLDISSKVSFATLILVLYNIEYKFHDADHGNFPSLYFLMTKNISMAGLITSTCGKTEEDDLSRWHFYISGVLTAGAGVVGLLGNILSIVTLLQK